MSALHFVINPKGETDECLLRKLSLINNCVSLSLKPLTRELFDKEDEKSLKKVENFIFKTAEQLYGIGTSVLIDAGLKTKEDRLSAINKVSFFANNLKFHVIETNDKIEDFEDIDNSENLGDVIYYRE